MGEERERHRERREWGGKTERARAPGQPRVCVLRDTSTACGDDAVGGAGLIKQGEVQGICTDVEERGDLVIS